MPRLVHMHLWAIASRTAFFDQRSGAGIRSPHLARHGYSLPLTVCHRNRARAHIHSHPFLSYRLVLIPGLQIVPGRDIHVTKKPCIHVLLDVENVWQGTVPVLRTVELPRPRLRFLRPGDIPVGVFSQVHVLHCVRLVQLPGSVRSEWLQVV
jgi:hypothetical protein